MSVALTEAWTVQNFLRWAEKQEGRYEFDGTAPVAMTGGSMLHSRICLNLHMALQGRLRGASCRDCGPDAGVAAGRSARYPDAVISCTTQPGTDLLVAQPVVVFEVLSPSTARLDRITKVREYAVVPSIRRYALIESRFAGVTVLHRAGGSDVWTSLALALEDMFAVPEAGIEFPVVELYENVEFPPEE